MNTRLGKLVKRFFSHSMSIGLFGLLLFGVIATLLIRWKMRSSDADNYLAEFVGVVFTIYFIDFINSERNRKQEHNIRDMAHQYLDLFSFNLETLLARLLSEKNISMTGNKIDIKGMRKDDIYSAIYSNNFWQSDIEISYSQYVYRISRRELFKSTIEYTNEGINKILHHYNSIIPISIRDLLHTTELSPEEYIIFNASTDKDTRMVEAEYIQNLIGVVRALREYCNESLK